jgi:peroxiredoxin
MLNFKRLCAAALAAIFVFASFARAQTPAEPERLAKPTTSTEPAQPAQPAQPEHPILTEFKVIFTAISAKLQAMQERPTEAALAGDIKQIDDLLAKYSTEKSDEVASVILMKARLYLEVLENSEKAVAILKQIKADYPATEIGRNLDSIIASVEKQIASDGLLDVGKPFPAFSETDLAGKPLTLESFKGKIVLIDFWATWCGPCVAELPNVIAAYEKYHAKGFDIVGISLDRERAKLDDFLTKNKMPWSHYFDENGKLATEYGIQAIPSTYLLDKEGKIVAKDLRGDALERELAKLLP